MSLISVIVPVYNAGEFLLPCLESIAAQTHTQLEVLLVENASADNSRQVCMEFCARDSRFVCITQEQNLGSAGARGLGVAHAKGEHIAFVDGDDLLHPQMLEALLHAMQTSGQPLACCRFAPFFPRTVPENAAVPAQWEVLEPPRHLRALLLDHRVDYSLCNKLYAAQLLRPQQFSTPVAHNEDLLINWRALQSATGMVFLDFVGYHYRQHDASISHRPLQPAFITDQAKVAQSILADAQGTDLAAAAQAFYEEKLLYLYSMILRQSDAAAFEALRRPLRDEIRRELRHTLSCPELSARMKLVALATVFGGPLYAQACRRMLKDRQH